MQHEWKLQPDFILQDVIAWTPKEHLPKVFDAYQLGVEDAFIAICRDHLIKPAHIKHAQTLMEVCIEQAWNQILTTEMGQMREGVDL